MNVRTNPLVCVAGGCHEGWVRCYPFFVVGVHSRFRPVFQLPAKVAR